MTTFIRGKYRYSFGSEKELLMQPLLSSPNGSLWRVYNRPSDRRRALSLLLKDPRFNYFTMWRDVKGFALQATHADWVAPGQNHVDW